MSGEEVENYTQLIKADEGTRRQMPECAVCLSVFEVGEECRMLPCFHLFHHECITEWLTGRRGGACPCCKQRVLELASLKAP